MLLSHKLVIIMLWVGFWLRNGFWLRRDNLKKKKKCTLWGHCSSTIPTGLRGTWTARRTRAWPYCHRRGAEIQRKPAASTEDQLPAAGLAMETLTIGRETAIKLYCEKISSTVKNEMIPSIMLKSYYACCTWISQSSQVFKWNYFNFKSL